MRQFSAVLKDLPEVFYQVHGIVPILGLGFYIGELGRNNLLAGMACFILGYFVLVTPRRWLLRTFITIVLVAGLHDLFTGQLPKPLPLRDPGVMGMHYVDR